MRFFGAAGLFVSAALSTLSVSPVWAAGGVLGTLRGNVVDQTTGALIGGAVVSVASGSGTFRQTTDARGFFAFVDLPADTYAVGIAARNYEPLVLRGVTVLGDGTQSIGVAKLLRGLRTIGKVSTRNASSAFQPNQTMDETTFQGARIDQALGETDSTNLNQLVLSAPGVKEHLMASRFPARASSLLLIGLLVAGCSKSNTNTSTTSQTSSPTSPNAPPQSVSAVGPPDAARGRPSSRQTVRVAMGRPVPAAASAQASTTRSRKNQAAAVAWIKNPQPPMPKLYPSPLSEKDVSDVAAYVESL